MCVKYFVSFLNFSKHFSQYFCCWGYPWMCHGRGSSRQVNSNVLTDNDDILDLKVRKTPSSDPLLRPPDPWLAGDPAGLLPDPPLPGQGGHWAGYWPHHPHHHPLPQGDFHPKAPRPSLHYKLSSLEWRNISHVYSRLSSSLEASHHTRF